MNTANPPVRESNYFEEKTHILEQFGLSRNDIKVYNSVLRLGRTKTGPIIRETRVSSSRVYASLQRLINKGLISYQVKNNVKYYQSELPDELISEVEKGTRKLKELSKELQDFPILPFSRNETNTFEGMRGLKMAYEQHVSGMDKGEHVCIVAFVGEEYSDSIELQEFFSNTVDRIMIAKKSRGRMITNSTISKAIKKHRPDSSIYDIRYLSEHYTLPYSLNISRREVMMSVWGEEPIVFTIKNQTIVKAFQKNFDYLWGIAKKK